MFAKIYTWTMYGQFVDKQLDNFLNCKAFLNHPFQVILLNTWAIIRDAPAMNKKAMLIGIQ